MLGDPKTYPAANNICLQAPANDPTHKIYCSHIHCSEPLPVDVCLWLGCFVRSGQILAPPSPLFPLYISLRHIRCEGNFRRTASELSLTTRGLVRNPTRGMASVLVTSFCARYKISARPLGCATILLICPLVIVLDFPKLRMSSALAGLHMN